MNKYIEVLTLQEHKGLHQEAYKKCKDLVKSLLTKKGTKYGSSR